VEETPWTSVDDPGIAGLAWSTLDRGEGRVEGDMGRGSVAQVMLQMFKNSVPWVVFIYSMEGISKTRSFR